MGTREQVVEGLRPLLALPDDAILQMRHAVALAEPGLFQLDSLRALIEQPAAPRRAGR
jgi:hypothetical protein